MNQQANDPTTERLPVTSDQSLTSERMAPARAIAIGRPTIGQMVSLFAALFTIICFFLPWAKVLVFHLSGFQLATSQAAKSVMPSLPILWIIPVGTAGLIILILGKGRFLIAHGLISIAAVSIGILNVVVILYHIVSAQSVIPLLFGIYASLLGSLVVATGGIIDVVYKSSPEAAIRIKIPTNLLRAYTMLLALVVIWLFFQWATIDERNPYGLFLGAVNFSKLLQQMAVTGVLAVGMLMVIVCGNIDLSVGAVVGLAGGIAALTQSWGLIPSLASAILVGLAIGALQGALVAYVNIPAFIVTLGGLEAWRGVILKLTKGATIPVELPFFRSLGRDFIDPRIGIALAIVGIVAVVWTNIRRRRARQRHGLAALSVGAMAARILVPSIVIVAFIFLMNQAGGVPIPVIFLLAVAIAGAFLTANTTFGRYLYAIGGNAEAARLSGINLKRYVLAAFCLMGALAGLASILHTARVGSASPDAGTLMELDAIASCVIGGTSLMGGRGTVFGAVLGALILASLDNGMSLLNVENWAQYVVKGGVLVAAVGFDMFGRRKT